MQLSKNLKEFCQLFSQFSKSATNPKHFEKKMTLIAYIFSKLQTVSHFFITLSRTELENIPISEVLTLRTLS